MSERTHGTSGSAVSNFPRKILFATDGSEEAALAAIRPKSCVVCPV